MIGQSIISILRLPIAFAKCPGASGIQSFSNPRQRHRCSFAQALTDLSLCLVHLFHFFQSLPPEFSAFQFLGEDF
jgi:hypothetical protein